MPKGYYHDKNQHTKDLFVRRVRKAGIFLLVLFGLAVGLLFVDSWRANKRSSTPSEPTQATTVTYDSSIEVQQTAFFQFQADKSWSLIVNESSESKYVYRSLIRKLVEHEVTIWVNDGSPLTKASRALPVEYATDDRIRPGIVSDHCSKVLPKTAKKEPQVMVYQETEFLCDYHSNEYTVLVGLRGGGTSVPLSRPNGEKIAYTIYYRNLTATPDDAQLQQIVSSFQAR